jgi:hypothetical protein
MLSHHKSIMILGTYTSNDNTYETYTDLQFHGNRAIYENPVNPSATADGLMIYNEILGQHMLGNDNKCNNNDIVVWARPEEFMKSPCLTDGFAAGKNQAHHLLFILIALFLGAPEL